MRTINKKRKRLPVVFTRSMSNRLKFFLVFVILIALALNIRILILNKSNAEDYSVEVLSQQNYQSKTIPFKRGDIIDRNGVTLATSVKVYNMILDPKLMIEKDYYSKTIKAIEDCFDYDIEEIKKIVEENKDRSYIVYKKKLSYEEIKKFQDLKADEDKSPFIKGVWFETEYERKYPFQTLACHVLGFTSAGNVGTWGIEEYYDSYLDGVDGREYGDVNSDNIMEKVKKEATNGNTVVSTIDFNLQTIVEKYVAQWKKDYTPENIGVILMNPKNGEVLAMASDITYNLNNPRDLSLFFKPEEIAAMNNEQSLTELNKIWRNYCISDTFEPGSTFKPFTIATAIEEGKVNLNQTFVCDGGEDVGGWRIKCHKVSGHGTINLQQAIAFSCNDVLMQVANLEGAPLFTDYQSRFGFGQKTGIDLPGEASCAGLLYKAEDMKAADLATNSFGQNFNVTMLQVAAGFSSVINGGNYYEPHVVKEILNTNGGIALDISPKIIKKTVTKETSDFIKGGLELCVSGGTGTKASVNGYTIGGKTGTAQKYPRTDNEYILSFIGYAGKEEPELVCYVLVDNATGDNQATFITTTLFSSIMSEALPYMNIFPDKEVINEEQTTETPVVLPVEETTVAQETTSVTEETTNNKITENQDDSQGEVAIPYIP